MSDKQRIILFIYKKKSIPAFYLLIPQKAFQDYFRLPMAGISKNAEQQNAAGKDLSVLPAAFICHSYQLSERYVHTEAEIHVHVVYRNELRIHFPHQLVHSHKEVETFRMEIHYPAEGSTER